MSWWELPEVAATGGLRGCWMSVGGVNRPTKTLQISTQTVLQIKVALPFEVPKYQWVQEAGPDGGILSN